MMTSFRNVRKKREALTSRRQAYAWPRHRAPHVGVTHLPLLSKNPDMQ
jgi:hypothetical protein